MATEHWQFIFSILHILGIVIFAGGQFWFAVLTSPRPSGAAPGGNGGRQASLRFVVRLLPRIANFNGLGILILLVSGLGQLFVWRQPGLLLLPSLYGWLLFVKLLLYMVLVVNGIFIEHRHISALAGRLKDVADPDTDATFQQHWIGLRRRSRVNFVLTMVMVVIGETLALGPGLGQGIGP